MYTGQNKVADNTLSKNTQFHIYTSISDIDDIWDAFIPINVHCSGLPTYIPLRNAHLLICNSIMSFLNKMKMFVVFLYSSPM